MSQMDREMYLYECTDCTVVFAVESAFDEQSDIVCPVCQFEDAVRDAGTVMATLIREPEGSE